MLRPKPACHDAYIANKKLVELVNKGYDLIQYMIYLASIEPIMLTNANPSLALTPGIPITAQPTQPLHSSPSPRLHVVGL